MPPYVLLYPASSRALVQRPCGHKLRQIRGSALPAVQTVPQGLQLTYTASTQERTAKICHRTPQPHLQSSLNQRLRARGILTAAPASPRLIQGPIHRAPAAGTKKRGISPDFPEGCSARGLPGVNAVNRASGALQPSPDGTKRPAPGASGNKASTG